MNRSTFLRMLKLIHPRFRVLSSTSKKQSHILIECRDCKNQILIERDKVFERSTKCPHCAYSRVWIRDIRAKLKDMDFTLIRMLNIDSSEVRCNKCGNISTYKNKTILKGKIKCNECIRPKLQQICTQNDLTLLSFNANRIWYLCNSCGKELKMLIVNFLKAIRFCKSCSSKDKITHEQFLTKVKDKNIEILSEYKGMNHDIEYKCLNCNTVTTNKAINVAYTKNICEGCKEEK